MNFNRRDLLNTIYVDFKILQQLNSWIFESLLRELVITSVSTDALRTT